MAGIGWIGRITGKPGEVEEADFAEPFVDGAAEGNFGGVDNASVDVVAEEVFELVRRGFFKAVGDEPMGIATE